MKRLKITTKTRDEIATAFTAVFTTIQSLPGAKDVTQADRLEPYRKEIMKQRKRGLSWKQIAEGMGDPMIGERVSQRTLKAVFEPKKPEPVPAPAAPATAPDSGPDDGPTGLPQAGLGGALLVRRRRILNASRLLRASSMAR